MMTIFLANAAEPGMLVVAQPQPFQVIQRDAQNLALVTIDIPKRAIGKWPADAVWEYQVTGMKVDFVADRWKPVADKVRMPVGIHRLGVRVRVGANVLAQGIVEPVSVGDVYIVAGQSYATNCNDEQFRVASEPGSVTAYDVAKRTWNIANDPQPAPDGSDGGSIWPPLGDALARASGVPVGFVNVAWGATASAQWLPGQQLHTRLVDAGKTLGRFRAVLWQQGESDVIAKTSGEQYVKNLVAIHDVANQAWGFAPPWYLAKSTLHPTVYNDPEGEARIRGAIDELVRKHAFSAGPDTDTLKGENRGDTKSRRHFSPIGQRRAAAMWFTVLKLPLAAELQPAWATPIVTRESSILLQSTDDGPITARLAFPASAILSVTSATGEQTFAASDYYLSDDGHTLTFTKTHAVPVITAKSLFVPKGSPHSYAHKVGDPNTHLLYQPGRWFHDRDIEVTYRRRDAQTIKDLPVVGDLPKTRARLKMGQPITLGISGDSISTGLDASALTKAPPMQPGFAELVVRGLESQSASKITLKNRAVSGWSVASGVQDLDKLLAEKPDLIIVAYGMNDVGRRDPKWYREQTQMIVTRIQKALPECEIVLVATMLGNKDWIHTPREQFAKYRDELKAMTGPGVALADLTAMWELLLKHKHDMDLTGNGLNHPNDFGHRLYAQAILAVIGAE